MCKVDRVILGKGRKAGETEIPVWERLEEKSPSLNIIFDSLLHSLG
jgi:hypothetical protein